MGDDCPDGALLLRREHQRPRAPARLPRAIAANASGRGRARDPGPRQRLRRRLRRLVAQIAQRERDIGEHLRLIVTERRAGQGGERLAAACETAKGEFCLLLNEDSELLPGAAEALLARAATPTPRPAPRARSCSTPPACPQPCAWRLPGLGTALAQALFLHRWLVTESGGDRTRRVGWAQSAAMLVRRERRRGGRLPRPRLLRLLRRDRLLQAPPRRRLAHPLRPRRRGDPPRAARTDRGRRQPPDRRVPPQPRPLHAQAPRPASRRLAVRALTAFSYLPRALAALVLPGHDPAGTRSTPARPSTPPARASGSSPRAASPSARASSTRDVIYATPRRVSAVSRNGAWYCCAGPVDRDATQGPDGWGSSRDSARAQRVAPDGPLPVRAPPNPDGRHRTVRSRRGRGRGSPARRARQPAPRHPTRTPLRPAAPPTARAGCPRAGSR